MRTTLEGSRFVVQNGRPGTGQGLFAYAPIRKDDFILEYTGKRLPTAIADETDSKYLFEIDSEWTIDGETKDNVARFINHACEPNVEADIIDGKILIHALRDISEGEELTIDYGEEYFDEFIRPFGCRCAKCLAN